jgi:adenylate kinase
MFNLKQYGGVSVIILFFGPPCSGKTTTAKLLASNLGLSHISFQELCLTEAEAQSELGQRWSFYMNSGRPFDRDLANQIAQKALNSHDSFVLEGYPKRKYEVEFFYAACGSPDMALVLNAQETLLYSRCQKRRICSQCNQTFSIDLSNMCPQCGGVGQKRHEDNVETFAERLVEYRMQAKETVPELKRIAARFMQLSTDELAPEVVVEFIKRELGL